MPQAAHALPESSTKSRLDRSLSLFAEIQAGEGTTVVLMLVNALWISLLYLTYPRDAARMTATLEERRLLALSAAAPTVDPNPCR